MPANLTPFQQGLIEIFVRLAGSFSLPRSLGEIYGLLFGSNKPLSLDDVVSQLGISRGSAHQGLQWLKKVGAIRSVYVPGLRKEHFAAEVELRQVALGLLREQIEPRIRNGTEQLERLHEIALSNDGNSSFESNRLAKLKRWHRFAARSIPLIRTIAGKF